MKQEQRTVTVEVDPPMSQSFRQWSTPHLVRLGTVADVTSRVDATGRNDGGSGQKKRT